MSATTEIRTTEERLALICKTAEEMLQMSFEALKHEQIDLGEMAEKLGGLIQEEERELFESVVERAAHYPDQGLRFQRYIAVAAHLGRVGGNLLAVLYCVKNKMEEGISFSPAAMQEVQFLFESLQYVLRCIKDAILTGNPILVRYILDTGRTLDASADKAAQDHEARLIAGGCRVQAAAVYFDLLDSLKGIVHHTRLIAERLGG